LGAGWKTTHVRILHVIDGLGGSGGAENRMVEEIVRFDPRTEQMMVRLYERDFLEAQLELRGIPVAALGLRGRRGAYNWPLAARRLRRVVAGFRPDVLHTSLFVSNLVGQLTGLTARIPVVSTMTLTGDPELHRRFQPGASTRRAALMRRIAAWVARHEGVWYRAITRDAMTTNCRAMRLPEARVRVIPRGVDMKRSRTTPDRRRFSIPDRVPLLVNVARQTAQKGHVLLLEAFRQVLEEEPEAHLAMAGEESDATPGITRAVERLGLKSRVHLLGFRPDADTLMASGDAFVFSSLAEGFGTVVLEALAAGSPVVAFDIPPIREVVGAAPAVSLVPTGDVAELARQAVRTLRTRNAGQIEQAGRWVAERYDVQVIASRMEEYLRWVASEAKR
jgi:glycosyltransferase involved in cell wall biosynthesis